MKKILKFLLILLMLLLLLSAGVCSLHPEIRTVSYRPGALTESAAELHNPYAGWYHIYGYLLSDGDSPDLSLAREQEPGPGLVLLEINLKNYITGAVSDTALGQMDDLLAAWQAAGKQLILRFLYDWDGESTEPDTLDLVLEHMAQTAEVVNRYPDCIYIIQGIYVGKWGEMHSSRYMNEEDMLTLIHCLDQAVHPDIFLAVRTPAQWRRYRDFAEDNAHSRIGLYNDGMLGSASDLGTYEGVDGEDSDAALRSRQAEIAFQNTLCSSVPNGGEVVIDNPYNDFPGAAADLRAIHVSYLNDAHDAAVLSKWERSVYEGGDIFSGRNGLEYISRHLGYRYVLRSSAFLSDPEDDEKALLSVTLENIGFSNGYRPFDVTLTLQHETDRTAYPLSVQTDTRLWNPGTPSLLEIPLDISGYIPGDYAVYLKITDPASGYEIFCANEGEHTENGYLLGEFAVTNEPIWRLFSAP